MRTMERLPVACLCLLLSCSAVGSADSRVVVIEGSDVILPCSLSTKEDIRSKVFVWRKDPQKNVFLYDAGIYYNDGPPGQDEQFRGRIFHFPDELQHGDASIIINKTKLADSGKYTCDFPRLQTPQTFHIELVVGSADSRVVVFEDSDVILPCSLNTKENIRSKLFDWRKDPQGKDPQKDVFLYDNGFYYDNGRTGQDEQFKGRVSHFPDELQHGDASIIINKTKLADSGKYTCDFPRLQPRQTFHIELVVVSRVVVVEGSDAILPCSLSTKEDIRSKLFDWRKDPLKEVFLYDNGFYYDNGRTGQDKQFEGRVSHFPDELQHGNASIIIRRTKLADSGNYTCDFPNLQPRQTSHIELVVAGIDRSAENLPGAISKPSVTILGPKDDGLLLQCEVQAASLEPKVEWRDSSGNILSTKEPEVPERRGSFNIILQATVSKTDTYRCVATQEKIYHQTEADIYVPVYGAAPKPYVKIVDESKHQALLQCEVKGASPKPKVEWRDSSGNILPAEEPLVTESGGRFDIILTTTVTKTDRYRCVSTQKEIHQQIVDDTYVYINESSYGWLVAGFVIILLIVVAFLLAVLYIKGYITLNFNRASQPAAGEEVALNGSSSKEATEP